MKILKNTVKLAAVGALTAGLTFAMVDAQAQETAGTAVSTTVLNAFTFTETQALTFGTFVAVADTAGAGPDVSTLVIDTAGADTFNNPGPNARLTLITAGAQGIFDITAAAPSAPIDITLPVTVTLTCGSCTGTNTDFTVNTFTSDAPGNVATTSGAGAVTVNVGATLNTIAGAGTGYEDGLYSGAYTVTASY